MLDRAITSAVDTGLALGCMSVAVAVGWGIARLQELRQDNRLHRADSDLLEKTRGELNRLDRWLAEFPDICLVVAWIGDQINNRHELSVPPRATPADVIDLRDRLRTMRRMMSDPALRP